MYNLKRLNGQNIINLDGLWQLDGKDIIVPYAPQSKKSHFIGAIKEEMTYVKTFKALFDLSILLRVVLPLVVPLF